MATVPRRSVLVVGGSTGFGAAIIQRMRSDGYSVIGTSRKASLTPLATATPDLQRLDVRDDASVAALQAHLTAQGFIPDVIVVNAGYGIAGPVENTSMVLAEAQFATNFFGLHRLVQAFLPAMRRLGAGQLIFIGSIAAQLPLPFQCFYSASKAALAAYSDALRMEVMAHGIKVSIVEPGDHRTEFGVSRAVVPAGADRAYEPQAERALALYAASAGPTADGLAALVSRIARTNRPRTRYRQTLLKERAALALRALLPGGMFERIIMAEFKIPRRR
mgnify:CR=1 FL=1